MFEEREPSEPTEAVPSDPRLFVIMLWAVALYPVYLASNTYLWVFDFLTDVDGGDTYWASPLLTVFLTVVAVAAGIVSVRTGSRLWKPSEDPHRERIMLIVSTSVLIAATLVIAFSAVVAIS